MISGATRYAGIGEEPKKPLGPGGEFITDTVNRAFGTKPKAPPVAHDSALLTTWSALGPAVQTTLVVLLGLYSIRFVRGVL